MTIDELKAKHLRKITSNYRYRRQVKGTNPGFVQNKKNCWIYSATTNPYLNGLGISTKPEDTKTMLASLGFDVNVGNRAPNSCAVVCELNQEKHLIFGAIDILNNTKLFANMLKAGYWFIYSRSQYVDLAVDIRQDGDLDAIVEDSDSWHSTEIGFKKETLKLVEEGTWEEGSLMDSFPWDSTTNFIASVRKGGISRVVLFIDIDPNFRK